MTILWDTYSSAIRPYSIPLSLSPPSTPFLSVSRTADERKGILNVSGGGDVPGRHSGARACVDLERREVRWETLQRRLYNIPNPLTATPRMLFFTLLSLHQFLGCSLGSQSFSTPFSYQFLGCADFFVCSIFFICFLSSTQVYKLICGSSSTLKYFSVAPCI